MESINMGLREKLPKRLDADDHLRKRWSCSQPFVGAVAAFFEDGESCRFSVAHRDLFGDLGRVETGDPLDDRLFTKGTMREGWAVDRSPQIKAPSA